MARHRLLALGTATGWVASLFFAAAPAAAASPTAFVLEQPVQIAVTSATQVAEMSLPAGTWWFSATATLESQSPNPLAVLGTVTCRIRSATTTLDQATWELDGLQDAAGVASVSLTTVRSEAGTWSANLTCFNSMINNLIAIRNVVLSAAQVSTSSSPLVKSLAAASATIPAGSSFHTVDTLALSKGRWWIVAKTRLSNTSSSGGSDTTCRMKLSTTDQDQTRLGLAASTSLGSSGELAVQVTHSFSSAGNAKLECKSSRDAFADGTSIVALKVGKLTRKAFGGSTSTTGTGTPRVFAGYKTASAAVPVGSYGTVGTLSLPAGAWLVSAKAQLDDSAGTKVDCTLSAGTQESAAYSFGGAAGGSTGLYLQIGVNASSATSAFVECKAAATGASLKNLRITAVKASSLTITSNI